MAASKVTRFHSNDSQFTKHISLIALYKATPYSNSKMVVRHLFCLMPISINKQELATMKETKSRKLQYH